jgi:uncharacterized membrane protein
MTTMRFEASVHVTSRPEDVYAVLSDYQQDPRWRAGVVSMHPEPPGPAQAGTTTDGVIRFLGITTRTPGQVTHLIEGQLLAWQAKGTRLIASGTRRVEPSGDGARVTLATDVRLRSQWRVIEPLLPLLYKRQLRADLARLKALIESPMTS